MSSKAGGSASGGNSGNDNNSPNTSATAAQLDRDALEAALEAAQNPELEVAQWLKEEVETERKRLEEAGAKTVVLSVLNTGLVVEDVALASAGRARRKGSGKAIRNRLSVDTSFDFDKVRQLMVSPPKPCPHKAGFLYVNVIMVVSDKAPPLLAGYLYDSKYPGVNDLSRFRFVNKNNKTSDHDVEGYEDM